MIKLQKIESGVLAPDYFQVEYASDQPCSSHIQELVRNIEETGSKINSVRGFSGLRDFLRKYVDYINELLSTIGFRLIVTVKYSYESEDTNLYGMPTGKYDTEYVTDTYGDRRQY